MLVISDFRFHSSDFTSSEQLRESKVCTAQFLLTATLSGLSTAFLSGASARLAQAMEVAPPPHHGQRSEKEVKELFESFKERKHIGEVAFLRSLNDPHAKSTAHGKESNQCVQSSIDDETGMAMVDALNRHKYCSPSGSSKHAQCKES